jgi:hypothetical protein
MDKYTIYDIAKILNTSHTTIYNKINNKEIYKELRNVIIKQGKTRYIKADGIDILRKHIKVDNKETFDKDKESQENKENREIDITERFIKKLESTIVVLEKQLEIKDKQIESLTKINQVLLIESQNKQKLIESCENKSFWKRIFS